MSAKNQDVVSLREFTIFLPYELEEVCLKALDDPGWDTSPGSSKHHHNFPGGLAEHTLEVVRTVRCMATGFNDPDLRAVVTCAALLHDYGKIYEYEFLPDGGIMRTRLGREVGHVVWSWRWFVEHCAPCKFKERVGHAMLAHHGRREWGSPVEPQTPEAFILHSADMLSMQGGKNT